ncbi:MAG: carboxynorspermidine decarboxylase [Chitinivibrionales bacterium]|nr:carboxynorspermidine decarboxylase [Chitinivibrionales bacterium]
METGRFSHINIAGLITPCYLIHLGLLEENAQKIHAVKEATGCRILLALKAYAVYKTFGLLRRYLDGVCASSLHEARLGFEEFGKEVHTFAPAYGDQDFSSIQDVSDTVIFNSLQQWRYFSSKLVAGKRYGLRINPQHGEVAVDLYNPCAPYSRLGITAATLAGQRLAGISGLHFHALCEQNADTLFRVMEVVHRDFGSIIGQMQWLNLGGGHHITRSDYDTELLGDIIRQCQKRYPGIVVYLEPGEAIALNCGVLVSRVLDVVENQMQIAILDTSAETHMPDVLAMPYRPQVIGAALPSVLPYTYRLAGPTCLAGDVIGDYSFQQELKRGDIVLFEDMAHYSIVKNTTFNGVQLPAIATYDPATDQCTVLRTFGYEEYKNRQS